MNIKKYIKNIYKKYRKRKYKNIALWENDSRVRVGVECTRYFNKKIWKKNFQKLFPTINEYCQLKFIHNIYEKEILAPTLDIVFTTWINQTFIDFAARLKWAYIAQSGLEFLEDKKYNFEIKTSAGISSEGVAEYVICVCLMLLKKLYYAFNNQRRKIWKQDYFLENDINLLNRKKIGILGLGNNGRCTARIFKSLGCYVTGFDKEDIKLEYVDRLYKYDRLNEFIENSEILVICLPLTSETKNFITLRELQLLGNKGILINVARGDIVNESDLIYALRHRIICGAGLDVFNKEPLPRSSRLWKCSNAIITPHVAGNINNYVDKIQTSFIEELKKYIGQ